MKVATLIPARLDSARLPKKLICKVKNKPIVQWTYEGARRSKLSQFLAVLTDSSEIKDIMLNIGGNAFIVEGEFQSGTDRIAHFVKDKDFDIIVNVQADEPLIDGKTIDELIYFFLNSKCEMATLAVVCNECADNPDDVKVVVDKDNYALYFSRSKIPYNANSYANYLKHIGVYIYKKETLLFLHSLAQSKLEKAEKLEQLRALENSIKIGVKTTRKYFIGIDTENDLKLFDNYITNL